jgi:hypothetical protein
MAKEYLFGLMAENMRESMSMIKRKVLENLPSKRIEFIRGNGKMENNMVKVPCKKETT